MKETASRNLSAEAEKELVRDAIGAFQKAELDKLLKGTAKISSVSERAMKMQQLFRSIVILKAATGADEAEAIEAAEHAVDNAMENETYNIERNTVINYGTAGYYFRDAGKFGKGVGFAIDLINPIEDIRTLGDLTDEAATLYGEM